MKNVLARGISFCSSFLLCAMFVSTALAPSAQAEPAHLPSGFDDLLEFSLLEDNECLHTFPFLDADFNGHLNFWEVAIYYAEYLVYPELFYNYDMDWDGEWSMMEFINAYPECAGTL